MHDTYLGKVLLVGLGGFVGSSGRFILSTLVYRFVPLSTFPLATLVVNVAGCLVIGYLGGLMETRQALGPALRLFLIIGILGGFTTFSSFALETLHLTQAAEVVKALLNVAAQIVLGLTAAWLGYLYASPS